MGHTFIQIPHVCVTGGLAVILMAIEDDRPGFVESAICLKYSSV